ncbi:T9SS type A sorting domain-containing protein [candidate division GN15 bacterium]|nr:T9SS type A sorting domain-containing protein [candidate division GN15 bacterium]
MWSKMVKILALLTAALAVSAAATEQGTVVFDRSQIGTSAGITSFRYGDFPTVALSNDLSLPVQHVVVELIEGESIEDITWKAVGQQLLGVVAPERMVDMPTAADPDRRDRIAAAATERTLGRQPVYVIGERSVRASRYAELLIFPIAVDQSGQLLAGGSIQINIAGRAIAPDELRPITSVLSEASVRRTAEGITVGSSPDYLIVTSEPFVPLLQRLARYKIETGYRAGVVSIESITASTGGRDEAEQLREYLKAFHANGGAYVLLAGDETILPVRYAYHYNAYSQPALEMLQLCDLYFADLTGEWDVDNDGVWGERSHDQPDLTPELLVGRLPCADSMEFANYIDNLIAYETEAGGLDRGWLERTLYYSSDQMRDDGGSGQHHYIAGAFPQSFIIDTSVAVEQSSGNDPVPDNLSGAEIPGALADGYGIVQVLAHGRSDGYIVRSSGYNEWPKAYMLTAPESGAHGCLDSTLTAGKPAFWYSLACDNGGFDQDRPPFGGGRSMVQHLLGAADGAIGMVAYSRWGWVNSSHLLQRAFFDSLFAHPDDPAVVAMYRSKQSLPYYRDLLYGQNYYGDPTVRVYTSAPGEPHVTTQTEDTDIVLRVTDAGMPLVDARVIVTDSTSTVILDAFTDHDGEIVLPAPTNGATITVSAVKAGYTIHQVELGPSIVTDVDDDDLSLPGTFALAQNYPNPFNPTTTISFSLPEQAQVTLCVFNVLGQEVRRLIDATLPAGEHQVEWRARDDRGRELSSGVYLYRLEAGGFSDVKKMLLVR